MGDDQHFSLERVEVETLSKQLDIMVEDSLCRPSIELAAGDNSDEQRQTLISRSFRFSGGGIYH